MSYGNSVGRRLKKKSVTRWSWGDYGARERRSTVQWRNDEMGVGERRMMSSSQKVWEGDRAVDLGHTIDRVTDYGTSVDRRRTGLRSEKGCQDEDVDMGYGVWDQRQMGWGVVYQLG